MFIFTYVVSKIIESPEDLSINEVSFLLKGKKKQSFFSPENKIYFLFEPAANKLSVLN